MIAAQLDRLKEVDPETYERIARGIPLQPCGQYMVFGGREVRAARYHEAYMPFGQLLPEVACAWLQAVLQDAIQARGWQGIVLFNAESNRAVIDDRVDGMGGTRILAEREGDSPADALLKAYLEALSVA